MLARAAGAEPRSVPDEELARFKTNGMQALSGRASGILVDRLYGASHGRPRELSPGCAFILAADELDQPRGGPVVGTRLDPAVSAGYLRSVHADAAKLLVLWSADRGRNRRARMVSEFLGVCAEAGTPGIVEGVVHDPHADGGSLDEAIVAAARELGSLGPALYKCEVPTLGRGGPEQIERLSRLITSSLPCPWVVLSSRVDPPRLPDAVAAACRGGASGFLAGRGIWADVVGAADLDAAFAGSAMERLDHLSQAAVSGITQRPAS